MGSDQAKAAVWMKVLENCTASRTFHLISLKSVLISEFAQQFDRSLHVFLITHFIFLPIIGFCIHTFYFNVSIYHQPFEWQVICSSHQLSVAWYNTVSREFVFKMLHQYFRDSGFKNCSKLKPCQHSSIIEAYHSYKCYNNS